MSGLVDSVLVRPVRKKFMVMKAHRHSGAVALTFDDGPDPELTPGLLDTLRAENVTATFFLVGIRIEKRPDLVQRMAADGHEIGVHTFSHRRMAELGRAAYADEIERTAALIKGLTRRTPLLFRPPFGERTLQMLGLMIERRMRCIFWSVDLRDYTIRDREVLVRKEKETALAGGDILLFHDSKRVTVDAMPSIIGDIRSRGLSFATVPQLLRRSLSDRIKYGVRGKLFPGKTDGQRTGAANAG